MVLAVQLSTVVAGPDGEEVAEEITYLGPGRLFGRISRPPAAPASGPGPGTTVVLLNSGRIDHVGPGRLWVELARSRAAGGLRVVRVDLSGLGDSPARPEHPAGLVYSPAALDDVAEVTRAVSPLDPSAVVLMGLCSGAWHSVQAALAGGARGVVAINLVPPSPPGDPAPRSPEAPPGGAGYRARLSAAKTVLRQRASTPSRPPLPGRPVPACRGRDVVAGAPPGPRPMCLRSTYAAWPARAWTPWSCWAATRAASSAGARPRCCGASRKRAPSTLSSCPRSTTPCSPRRPVAWCCPCWPSGSGRSAPGRRLPVPPACSGRRPPAPRHRPRPRADFAATR